MKLKPFIIILSLIIITIIGIHQSIRINNQKNNIDYLEKLANHIKKDIKEERKLYYQSNNNSIKLYYKSQFAFAPYILINNDINNIPYDNLILVVTDLKNNSPNKYIHNLLNYERLSSCKDSLYVMDLIIKKK